MNGHLLWVMGSFQYQLEGTRRKSQTNSIFRSKRHSKIIRETLVLFSSSRLGFSHGLRVAMSSWLPCPRRKRVFPPVTLGRAVTQAGPQATERT